MTGPHHRPLDDATEALSPTWRVPVQAPAAARFAQLTYASYHREGESKGGWQVKDSTGGLTVDEQRQLVARVSTAVEPGLRPASFPSAEERAALPRRLCYGPVPGVGAAWWHSVPAGQDATLRPGNVFSHVVLDRAPTSVAPPWRPAELIGSRHWLCPFGSAEVLQSSLESVPEPPWPGEVDRLTAVEFLVYAARWYPGPLAALLDGVAAATAGGPTVVLGVEQPAQAGLWVAAVSQAMSPGTSRAFHWTIGERAGGVGTLLGFSHLVVVPHADLAAVEPDRRLVRVSCVDDDSVELGDVLSGAPHHSQGVEIAVTPWSAIVAMVVADPARALPMLDRQDAIAAAVGDRDLACGWPLAMAVAEAPEAFGDAQEEARLLLAGPAPAGLRGVPALSRVRSTSLARVLGATPADALAGAEAATGAARAFAVGVYLERAAKDAAWLLRREGVPVPEVAPGDLDPEVVERAFVALVDLRPRPGAAPEPGEAAVRTAARALRLLDVLVRFRLLAVAGARPDESTVKRVEVLTDRLIGPVLLDPSSGPWLVDAVGPLAEPTQAGCLRPWFDRNLPTLPGRPGTRLSPAVLRWLYPVPPAPPDPAAFAGPPDGVSALLVELAGQVTATTADPSALRAVAAWSAAGAGDTAELARLSAAAGWPTSVLGPMVRRFGAQALVPMLLPALLLERDSEELDEVVDRVRDGGLRTNPAAAAVVRAADLRFLTGVWWSGGGPERSTYVAAQLLDLAEQTLIADRRTRLAVGPQRSLIAAYAADILSHPEANPNRPAVHGYVFELVNRHGGVTGQTAAYLTRAVEAGTVLDTDVVFAAQMSSPDPDAVRRGPKRLQELGKLVVREPGGEPEPLLDRVVRDLLRRLPPPRIPDLIEAVRQQVQHTVAEPDGQRVGELVFGEYERFARRWWRQLGVSDDTGFGAAVLRWFRG